MCTHPSINFSSVPNSELNIGRNSDAALDMMWYHWETRHGEDESLWLYELYKGRWAQVEVLHPISCSGLRRGGESAHLGLFGLSLPMSSHPSSVWSCRVTMGKAAILVNFPLPSHRSRRRVTAPGIQWDVEVVVVMEGDPAVIWTSCN